MNEEKKDSITPIKQKVREQTIGYITAAFGLVAGLAWNEAIKSLIDTFFVIGKNGLLAKFTYALLVTLVVVLISMYLAKISGEKKD